MLGRKKRVLTYLGPETEVLGDLKAKGQVRVDGLVRGSVWVEGERVEAQAIQVHGEVRADLEAERVFLAKTARLTGNVRAQALEVEAGAVFVGQSVAGETRALEAPKEA